jgi:hypothetical protein
MSDLIKDGGAEQSGECSSSNIIVAARFLCSHIVFSHTSSRTLVRSFIHACALDVRLLLLLVNVQLSLMLQAYCHHHILSVLHFHSTLCRQTPLSSGHATNHATFQSPITAGFNNPPVMMLMQPSGFAHAPPGVFPAHFQPMLPSTAGANLKRLRPSELSGGSIAFNGWLSHHICSCTFPLVTNCSIFMPCIV